jgi:hypothetical protein
MRLHCLFKCVYKISHVLIIVTATIFAGSSKTILKAETLRMIGPICAPFDPFYHGTIRARSKSVWNTKTRNFRRNLQKKTPIKVGLKIKINNSGLWAYFDSLYLRMVRVIQNLLSHPTVIFQMSSMEKN